MSPACEIGKSDLGEQFYGLILLFIEAADKMNDDSFYCSLY
jgi:hypothetical protein